MSQYDAYADDFARTRSRPWKFLDDLLQELLNPTSRDFSEYGVDIGCGNGRNASPLKRYAQVCIGIDPSLPLLHKAKNHYADLIQASLPSLPLRARTVDLGFCIAVLHHVIPEDARIQAVHELQRVLKPKKHVVITVWRRWQERFRKFFLHEGFQNAAVYSPAGSKAFGDIDAGWIDSKNYARHPRLYHLFTGVELRRLLQSFRILRFELAGPEGEKTNYFVVLEN